MEHVVYIPLLLVLGWRWWKLRREVKLLRSSNEREKIYRKKLLNIIEDYQGS